MAGFEKIRLDASEGTVVLPPLGVKIDLGGIGKGYAVDRAVERLKELGIGHAIVDAGGDLRLIGGRPGKAFWRIGVRHPVSRQSC